MSMDIFQPNHKLSLNLANRDGSSVEFKVVINTTLNEEAKKSFNVSANTESLEKVKNSKLSYLALHTNLKGFRPGKAPLNLIWKQHQGELTSEIANDIINNTTQTLVNKINKDLVIAPKINLKQFSLEKGLEFEVSLDLMPEFELPDESKISIEKPVFEITEKDIKNRTKTLMKQHKNFAKAEGNHAAKDGDKVIIDFEGKINGEVFAGGTAKNFSLELGSKSFIDTFETQLLKHKAGDEVLVKVTFPESYHEPKFAGKPAEFTVKIHEVHQPSELKDDAELATSLGFKSEEDFHNRVKEIITKECEGKSLIKLKTDLFDKIDALCIFNLPEVLVEEEFASLWKNVEAMIKNKNAEVKDKSENELKEEYTKLAKRRVKLGIVLTKLAQKYQVTVEQNDLIEAVRAQAMANPAASQAIIKYYTENPKAIETLKGPILEEKVVKLLLSKVTSSEKPTKVEDLLALD